MRTVNEVVAEEDEAMETGERRDPARTDCINGRERKGVNVQTRPT